jgi:hypothetical protein
MVDGSWFMVHGSWFIVHGSWAWVARIKYPASMFGPVGLDFPAKLVGRCGV